jgi:hypothetical protein
MGGKASFPYGVTIHCKLMPQSGLKSRLNSGIHASIPDFEPWALYTFVAFKTLVAYRPPFITYDANTRSSPHFLHPPIACLLTCPYYYSSSHSHQQWRLRDPGSTGDLHGGTTILVASLPPMMEPNGKSSNASSKTKSRGWRSHASHPAMLP